MHYQSLWPYRHLMPQRLILYTFEVMYLFSAISGIVMHGISVFVEAAFVFGTFVIL